MKESDVFATQGGVQLEREPAGACVPRFLKLLFLPQTESFGRVTAVQFVNCSHGGHFVVKGINVYSGTADDGADYGWC